MSRIVASSPANDPAWPLAASSFRFAPHPDGTYVEVDAHLSPRGPFRLLQPLMRWELAAFLANLPEWIRTGLETTGSSQSVSEGLDDLA